MHAAGAGSMGEDRVPSLLLRIGTEAREIVPSHFPFTIGRKADRDLVLNDAGISREHAVISREGGQFFLADASSRRGTFVNGTRCSRLLLAPGDSITFGAPEPEIVFDRNGAGFSTQSLFRNISSSDDASDLGKLTLFLQAARALTTSRVVDEVLITLLDYAIKLIGAERGFVFLKDKHGANSFTCGRDNRGRTLAEEFDISHSVLSEAFQTGADFVVGDTSQMSMLSARQSIVTHDLRTVVAIPLRSSAIGRQEESSVFGVLYLDSHFATHKLSNVSHAILRAIATDATALVENARLVELEQAAARYRRELEIANSIQQALIPPSPPSVPFATILARTIPCTEVGGDFYDFVSTPAGLVTVLSDISGKGISAALLASSIQGMLYSQLSAGMPLVEAAHSVNTFLCSRMSGRKYATLVLARLAPSGELEVVNCGHLPPVVVKKGKASFLEEGSVPVGLFDDATFQATQTKLPRGGRLVLYTDGLSEAENAAGEDFGQDKLRECLAGKEPVEELFAAVAEFTAGAPAQDDRTLVVIDRTA